MAANVGWSIGDLARRTGLAVSAIRFYEQRGLLKAARTAGGQRRFESADVRRLSFVLIAQKLGFTIEEIAQQLASLPNGRPPGQRDWTRMSKRFRADLQSRIDGLIQLRDNLDGCIGCGCLSLKKCALYNPQDEAADSGAGPRFLLGERSRAPKAAPTTSRAGRTRA
ncbi:MAG: redox-sensitive transcriptional activator SoxR [Gammaproteobacteria bacterium]